MTVTQTSAVRRETSVARAVANTLKGSLGNLVEWYDVYTYTVFASFFEKQFFAEDDANSTVYVYAIFAVTFIARPFGSWFFGRYADRHGRKAALTLSVTIMAACSLLIAILPTRETVGLFAAAALTLLRFVQGFATGGEYATSATYMSEAATSNRRGFFSSFQYLTLVGGQVFAQLTLLILSATMSTQEISAWGWRIPFAIGGLAAVVVFWLRKSMDESLTSDHLAAVATGEDRTAGTLRSLFRDHWKAMLTCFLLTLGGTVSFYAYTVNGPAVVKGIFKDDPMTGTWVNLISLLVLMALQPLGGWISDRIGRKPVFLWFCILATFWTFFFVTNLPQQKDPIMAGLYLVVSFVILLGYTSINAIIKAELFPARVRALGVGLSYGLANSIFAGTTPLIYQALKQADAIPVYIGYVTTCIVITLITALIVLKNKAETHIDREQGHAYEGHRGVVASGSHSA